MRWRLGEVEWKTLSQKFLLSTSGSLARPSSSSNRASQPASPMSREREWLQGFNARASENDFYFPEVIATGLILTGLIFLSGASKSSTRECPCVLKERNVVFHWPSMSAFETGSYRPHTINPSESWSGETQACFHSLLS